MRLPGRRAEADIWNNWDITLTYKNEKEGPFIIDLTHRPKLDVQDRNPGQYHPWGVEIPEKAGLCTLSDNILVSRMNRTQASVWHLSGDYQNMPGEPAFTDITDSKILFALIGEGVLLLAEKLSALDLSDPRRQPPFMMQGPFSHVSSQVVVLDRNRSAGAIIVCCARGYANDMVQALSTAGEEFSLRSAGQIRFSKWLEENQTPNRRRQ